MNKKISFHFKKKRISIDAEECSFFRRLSGLMFTRRKNAKALLFDFKKPSRMKIHSLFVFFPFLAVWLDEENNIIDMKKIKPFVFSVSPKKPAFKLVEIPINEKYKRIITIFNTSRR